MTVMPTRISLDTNVVLDVLLARAPFLDDSQAVWQACDDGRLSGHLLASALTDISYITRRIAGRNVASRAVEVCLAAFTICPVDRTTLEAASAMPGSDFEDNLQIAAAMQCGIEAIITRNPADFAHSPLPILTPAALRAQLS